MRLFIGIRLPASVRKSLADAARGSGLDRAPWRAVPPDTLHLTLAFLGETDPGSLAAIREAVDRAGRTVPGPFVLEMSTVRGFPPGEHARLAVVGVSAGPGAETVRALAAYLRADLGRIGIAYDRRPHCAHITLARTAGARNGHLDPDPPKGLLPAATVDAMVLWESHLGGPHATHVPLHVGPFGPLKP